MSPGIRSGVNCTRRVSTDSAPARVRTSSVLAMPGTPSISTWPPHSSATSRPETAASWPTTALPTSVRTAASRSRALVRLGVCLGHGRRTSLSSSASWLARVIRSWSVDGTAPAGPSSGHDVLDRRVRCAGRPRGRATSGRVGGAEPEPLGEPGPGGRAQRLRGVAAVAGPAVEPAPAAGGLDGAHDDRQRLGRRARRAGGPATGSRDHGDREQPQRRAGASRGSRVARLTPSSPMRSSSAGHVPDQPVVLARAAAARRRRCRRAGPGRW